MTKKIIKKMDDPSSNPAAKPSINPNTATIGINKSLGHPIIISHTITITVTLIHPTDKQH